MKKGESIIILITILILLFVIVVAVKLIRDHDARSSNKIPASSPINITENSQESADIERNRKVIQMIFGTKQIDAIYSTPVTLTAYSATDESECDETPEITANGTPSRIGIAALSRDLITEMGLIPGQVILIPDLGFFSVFSADDKLSTHKRKNTANPIPIRRQIDILHANKKAAQRFGERPGTLVWFAYKESS